MPTVAILGASADPNKFGNRAVRAHLRQGYEVYPVNPKGGEIAGLTVYPNLQSVPVELDRISVYLPPAVTLQLLDEIQQKGCQELWFNPGSESDELIAAARERDLEPIIACSILDLGESPHG